MLLSHLVHRIATDATFAAHLQQNPNAAANELGLDPSMIEAVLAVADGAWNWQALCAVSADDQLEGYWEADSNESRCAPLLPAQLSQDSAFLAALRGMVAPRGDLSGASVTLLDLPLLCGLGLGGAQQRADIVATAWGMLYTALHLLDNIEDNDKPNQTWARWGTGPTLNLTTGLLASTALTLDLLEEHDVSAQTIRAIQRDFNQTVLAMCGGQHDDLTIAQPSLEQCAQIMGAKSGTFFALACRAAARVATDDPAVIEQIGAFGQQLGMLVQLTDDLSGLWSWERADSDLGADKRWTLPLAYAMSVLPPAERSRLATSLAAADADSEAAAREMIIASGAALYLTTQAQTHYHAALRTLDQLPLTSAARTALLTLLQQAAPATINRVATLAPAATTAQPDKLSMFKAARMVTAA